MLTNAQKRVLEVIVEAGPTGISPGRAATLAAFSLKVVQGLVNERPDLVVARGSTKLRVLVATEDAREALSASARPTAGPACVPRGVPFIAEAAVLRAKILEALTDEWVGIAQLRERMGIERGDRLTRLMIPMIAAGQIETNGKPTSHRKYRRAAAVVASSPPVDFDVPKRAAAPIAPQRPGPPSPQPAPSASRPQVAEGPGALGHPESDERPKSDERHSIRVLRDALHDTVRTIAELCARRDEIADDIRALGGRP